LNTFRFKFIRLTAWLFFSLFLMFMLFCCDQPPVNNSSGQQTTSGDSIAELNRTIVKTELQEIDDFIARYHWVMKKTQTGLRYMIYKKGGGRSVKPGDHITIKYKINLLNGDPVPMPDSNFHITFEAGKRDVASGLEEGILQMNVGDHAKLIIPSHLAFGLLGDMASIPSRATLVYDVEICSAN
jgi:FKBP-type peptidyl-prolyl cis-trans isomerase FkpA